MNSWHSYPKVHNLGHNAIIDIFSDPIIIEEKVDGSQFSFGLIDGELKVKSKGKEFEVEHPEKMFNKAVETVIRLKNQLTPGYTYRAEYLSKPKHNVLAYDRVPEHNLIIFDISPSEEKYLTYQEKYIEAKRLGLECIPLLFEGKISYADDLNKFLETVSCLGGQKIEGYVVKNYNKFGKDGKVLLGKYVSEAFKEKHKVDWKEENPGQNDIVLKIGNAYRTGSRWDKAIQHLQEKGALLNEPKDIGLLLKEVNVDTLEECQEEIKELLFKWAWPQVSRIITKGFPEYYKQKLLERNFKE